MYQTNGNDEQLIKQKFFGSWLDLFLAAGLMTYLQDPFLLLFGSLVLGSNWCLVGGRFLNFNKLRLVYAAACTSGAAASGASATGAGAAGAGAGLGGLTTFIGSKALIASPYLALTPSIASFCLNLMAIRMP